MTQLIINGTYLPRTSRDKYKCYPQALTTQVEMISGRLVEEVRGTVQIVEYSYDKMDNATYTALLTALRGNNISVTYLPDDSDTMRAGTFLCTSKPTPTFAFEIGGKAMWHNVSFVLREVKPHD